MGCGASASAGQLVEAQRKVDALQRELAEARSEKGNLQRQLEHYRVQADVPTQPAPETVTPSAANGKGVSAPTAAPEPDGGAVGAAGGDEADVGDEAAAAHAAVPAAAPAATPVPSVGITGSGDVSPFVTKVPSLGAARKVEVQPPSLGSLGFESADSANTAKAEAALGGRTGTVLSIASEVPPLPGVVIWEEGVQQPAPVKEVVIPRLNVEDLQSKQGESSGGSRETLGTQAGAVRTKDGAQKTLQEMKEVGPDGKLSGSMASTASTCTPQAGASGLSSLPTCHQCRHEAVDLFLDTSDMNKYCENCWAEYYGHTPGRNEALPLVNVEVAEIWPEARLSGMWAETILLGWPPPVVHSTPPPLSSRSGQEWSNVKVRVHRQIVGPHAREQCSNDQPYPGEILAERYRVKHIVGEGHFTKAFMAEDLQDGNLVCLKRHRNLSVEALADLVALGKRLGDRDPDNRHFPVLRDAFYDVVGFTVETLIEGRNCLSMAQTDPGFFRSPVNLRHVAVGALRGLVLLEEAGAVHNDVKPDNLIWTQEPSGEPFVKLVDFGCARLDSRVEPIGRNWSLAEGGAGHLGKWSPEMALRLPITHASDVWGTAISLCELYAGRFMWRNEGDTAEVILAQSLGLCNLRNGVPPSLLRRSPLDVRQLYTPSPHHFPVRQNARGQLEALRPMKWGLEQVIGEGWRENNKADFGKMLEFALVVDPANRPKAQRILECCPFVCPPASPRPTLTAEAAGSLPAAAAAAGVFAAPPGTTASAGATQDVAAATTPASPAASPPASASAAPDASAALATLAPGAASFEEDVASYQSGGGNV